MPISNEISKLLALSKEDALILNILESEVLNIADISKQTKIPRTSLYYMLPKLQERELIKQIKVTKKLFWEKNSDEHILNSYTKVIESLSNNTPGITKTISKESSITFYQGNKQVINVLRELSHAPPRSRVYGIQPETSIIGAIENNHLHDLIDFNHQVKKSKLIFEGVIHESGTHSMVRSLTADDQKRLLESFSGRSADTVKLPEGFLNKTKAEIYLYNNKIALVNWYEEFGVVIDNKDVFNS
jgi:predicted transcriptional regulator